LPSRPAVIIIITIISNDPALLSYLGESNRSLLAALPGLPRLACRWGVSLESPPLALDAVLKAGVVRSLDLQPLAPMPMRFFCKPLSKIYFVGGVGLLDSPPLALGVLLKAEEDYLLRGGQCSIALHTVEFAHGGADSSVHNIEFQ
jgi:hypothetical protein